MAKFTFWYQLTWVVPEKVQRAVKWLCVSAYMEGCFYVFLAFQYYIHLMAFFLDNLGKPTPES